MSWADHHVSVRRRGEAFRPSWIFLAILGLFLGSGLTTWYRIGYVPVSVFLFVVAGWLVSLCLHEYAHALTAYRAGDLGVADRGYLTLNPLKYTHPFLSFLLPLLFIIIGGFGLPGGAVWVDRHAGRTRMGHSIISASGPAVNVGFALVLVAPFVVGVDVMAHLEFWAAVAFLCFLQLTASVLNLLPIPGVDGGNALQPWLSPQWQRGFDVVAPYGMFALCILLLQPEIGGAFFALVNAIGDGIGLPQTLRWLGWDLFSFWN